MMKRKHNPCTGIRRAWLLPGALCCATLLGGAPASAESWRQVEVILFTYTDPDAGGELWPGNPGLPPRHGAIDLLLDAPVAAREAGVAVHSRTPYRALPRSSHQLEGIARALAAAREYNLALHAAWQQPAQGGGAAVRLDNTMFEAGSQESRSLGRGAVAAKAPGHRPAGLLYDGIVRLRSGRLMHLDVDFAYFPPSRQLAAAEEPQAGAAAGDYVRLTASRRVRLGRRYHFDHPLFGLIVQVSRLPGSE